MAPKLWKSFRRVGGFSQATNGTVGRMPREMIRRKNAKLGVVSDPGSGSTILSAGLCPCIAASRSKVESASSSLGLIGNPQALVNSVWPKTLVIKRHGGYQVKIHKPLITIGPTALKIAMKVAVKKTRGVGQFSWTVKRTFDLGMPPEILQFTQAVGTVDGKLTSLANALTQVAISFNCPG